jgi:glycosyltransferase involved in cell wall biosynthesis
MRLAFLVFNDPVRAPDGTARFTGELARELARGGHHVIVVHGIGARQREGPREVDGVTFLGLHYHPQRGGGSVVLSRRAIPVLATEHRRQPFDYLVSFGPPFTLTLAARRRFPGARTVYFALGCMLSEWEAFRHLYRSRGFAFALGREARYSKMALFEMGLVRRSDRVVASSEHTRRALQRYGDLGRRAKLCYLGLRDPFDGRPLGEPGDAILHVATDHPRKGTGPLLQALQILRTRYGSEAPAWIVGPPEARYVEEAKRRGVQAEFLGLIPDAALLDAYRRCGLLALPAIDEGFGLPVLEASFAARPAVVTDVSCLPEIVHHGVDGLVVPPGDPEAFAAALHDLLADSKARRVMGERAREKAEGFTIDKVAARFLALLGKND